MKIGIAKWFKSLFKGKKKCIDKKTVEIEVKCDTDALSKLEDQIDRISKKANTPEIKQYFKDVSHIRKYLHDMRKEKHI